MLITTLSLSAFLALLCVLVRWRQCVTQPRPPLPEPTYPSLPMPPSREVWLELDDIESYNAVVWDRKIDAMLRTTARWQQVQAKNTMNP